MIFWGENRDGEKFLLGKAASVELSRKREVPADLLIASFSVSSSIKELTHIFAYENKELIFAGIVDEQITKTDKNGSEVKIVSRSLAALLLDNEAMPQTLANPTLRAMSELYVKPLGFSGIIGNNGKLKGEFEIKKGESCYVVLERYCRLFLNKKLYVSTHGVVYAYEPDEESVCLDDIISSEIVSLPCKKYSKVISQSGSGAYDTPFKGDSKIKRIRYSQLGDTISAPQRIAKAKNESLKLKIICKGMKLVPTYTLLNLIDLIGNMYEKLEIESMKYALKKGEEQTSFVLRPRQSTREIGG